VSPELFVIVPCFEEEQCLESVLQEWIDELDRTGVDYKVLLLDDGSTDGTAALISRWVQNRLDGRITAIRHANMGHGQTCLAGYRQACLSGAAWVFQIDSDGQCDPAYFREVWERREGHDVVYGHRLERLDGWQRVLASRLVRAVVRMSTGARCVDANVPYRLMTTNGLLPLVDSVPSGFDLANIALAVQIQRAGWREAQVPIVFRPRAGGEPTVPLTRFVGKALELIYQLLLLPRPVLPVRR
jgi:dolichol-phosphate mannosyltransferase